MPTVAVYNMQGAEVGKMDLSENVFAAEVNESALHTVVRAQLNAKRQGTQSALTRTEVRGGGRKIYRQKGTGNARHHGRRAPQFTHGGVVFAPKPRDYTIKVLAKVRRLAMLSALTTKVVDNDMIVLDKLACEGKTKAISTMLKALKVERKALVVMTEKSAENDLVVRAAANIPCVKIAYVNTINVLDILNYDKFIISQDAVKLVEEVYD